MRWKEVRLTGKVSFTFLEIHPALPQFLYFVEVCRTTLFSLRITAHDKWGQQIASKLHQGIRQLSSQDIDNVWRQYKRKAEQHYGSNLKFFSVVLLSKLDPMEDKFVKSQGKKQFKFKPINAEYYL